MLKPETYEDFDCFLSFLTLFPPVDERRIELKLPATVQKRTDFHPFLEGFGMQFYFEIYVTLEQNLHCLVYREMEFWFESRLNLVLELKELRQFLIASVQRYMLLYFLGFYLY